MLFWGEQPIPPFAYMAYLGEEPWYREVAAAGIHLYCVPGYLGDRGINPRSGIGPFRPALWRGEGNLDFSSLDAELTLLQRVDPQGKVVVRLHLDPPTWWERAYPEACCRLADGTTFRQCFASPIWRQSTASVLQACVKHLTHPNQPYQVIGIHVAAGGTEEWFYHFHETYVDENPSRTQAFRRWLRTRYGGEERLLQTAWCRPSSTFESVSPANISGTDRRTCWRPLENVQPVLDTFRFHCETMADNIAYFCRIVKEASQGRLLTGAFFGYHYYVNDPRRGHAALGKLLRCPHLDYLSSPNVYNRVLGEDWPPMVAVASVQHHGKLWLAENDTRTCKTTLLKYRAPTICPPGYYDGGVWVGPEGISDSVALLQKNTARMLAGGYGGWWFDMWGGWFSDPQLLAVLQRTQELGNMDIAQPGLDPPAQVCVVADEELAFHDQSYGTLTEQIMRNRYALAKSGAPYDLYLLSDIEDLPVSQYRVIWLLGPRSLSPHLEGYLSIIHKKQVTTLWTHPGGTSVHYTNGTSLDYNDRQSWSPDELRSLWKRAGVHVYLETNDVLYAGKGWIGIHTLKGGPRTLHLPQYAKVRDVFKERRLQPGTQGLFLELKPRTTTLLRLEPPSKMDIEH